MISETLKNSLSKLTFWANMTGSQFVDGLALLVEQIGERYKQACERALQESRLSTAVKRSSVLAEAEDRSYVARKASPSTGIGKITNKSNAFISVPLGEQLISSAGTPYIILDSLGVGANSNRDTDIAQLELRVIEVEVSVSKPYYEVLLSQDDSAVAHRVDVYVKNSGESGYVQWEKSYMFRGADENSRYYTEFYKPTEQLGIRFGNGKDGRIPPQGATVRLEIWCTLGVTTLVAGEKLSFTDDAFNESLSVEVVTSILGGQPPEDTEEIRNGAAYATQYDNQIVWGEDYMHFIRSNHGGLVFLNVWGEGEQEKEDGFFDLANNRTIFISAYSNSVPLAQLKESILASVNTLPSLNKRYKFVDPNINGITVTLDGQIPRTVSISDAQLATSAAIQELYGLGQIKVGNSSSGFQQIRVKDLWTLIDSLGIYSDFNLTVQGLDIERKLADYRYIDTENSTFNITYGDS